MRDGLIGIDPDYDYLLDPQMATPAGWCPECGAEIWERGENLCSRCRREQTKATARKIALSEEQSQFRVLLIYEMLKTGKPLSTREIINRLSALHGISVDRKTIYKDVMAIDRIMPIVGTYGPKAKFRRATAFDFEGGQDDA